MLILTFNKCMRLIGGTFQALECELQGIEKLAMASSIQQTQDGCTVDPKKMRKREFKLKVVKFYHKNNSAKRFSLNDWMLGCWRRQNHEKSRKALKRMTDTRKIESSELESPMLAIFMHN